MTGVRTARAFLTTGAAEGELAILSYPCNFCQQRVQRMTEQMKIAVA